MIVGKVKYNCVLRNRLENTLSKSVSFTSKEDIDAPIQDKYPRIIVGCVKYDCVLCDWLEGYNKY